MDTNSKLETKYLISGLNLIKMAVYAHSVTAVAASFGPWISPDNGAISLFAGGQFSSGTAQERYFVLPITGSRKRFLGRKVEPE